MKPFEWNSDKNTLLKTERGFGFEHIVEAIENGKLVADLPNSSKAFPHQRVMIVDLEGYAIVVPYVEDDEKVFLKTAYPDRKAKRRYLK